MKKAEAICYALAAWLLLVAYPTVRHQAEVQELQQKNLLLREAHSDEMHQYTDLKMTVTAYTASVEECGKSDGIGAFSDGAQAQAAVSPDRAYMVGKWVWVPSLGYKVKVNDKTDDDLRNTLDIRVKTKGVAKKIGRERRRVVLL